MCRECEDYALSLIAELKRRNVLRVVVGYLAAAWLLIQIADTVFPAYGLPESALPILITVLVIGLIPAVVISWAFELTPEGLKRDSAVSEIATPKAGKRFDRIVMVVLALAVGYFVFDELVIERQTESGISIAVLPFDDMSPTGDQDWFSDGVSEEILNLLAQIGELRVTSRSSAFEYRGDVNIPEVAAALGVAYILEGSVRQAGDTIRVTAQLIDAKRDRHVWSDTWDRELSDVFAVQDEVARDVADALHVQLLDQRRPHRTTDPETYALYLQARHEFYGAASDNNDLSQPLRLLSLALERDPEFVPAMTLISLIINYGGTYPGMSREEMDAENERLVQTAYRLDPDDPVANLYKGYLDHGRHGDYENGLPYFERALELDPNNMEVMRVGSYVAYTIGRFEDAIRLAERAFEINPACVVCYSPLYMSHFALGQWAEAEALMRQRIALANDPGGYFHLVRALLFQGRWEEALEALENLREFEFDWLPLSAVAFFQLGREPEAEENIRKFIDEWGDQGPTMVSVYYCLVDDTDNCLAWVARYVESEPRAFENLVWFPEYRILHDTPEWKQWRLEYGLDEARLAALQFNIPDFGT